MLVLARFYKKLTTRQQHLLVGSSATLSILFVYMLSRLIAELLFVVAECVHLGGIIGLIFSVRRRKSAAGISLKTQILTVVFLVVRFYCSLVMEKDIHTLLDVVTAGLTVYLIMYIRNNLKGTYSKQDDSLRIEFLLAPCALLAILVQPSGNHMYLHRVLWAFAVYVESVSILPQLKMMQNMKVITQLFAAHYVFALGCARGLSFLHWVFEFALNGIAVYNSMGRGLWPALVILSEVVQTAIYADFCYYYVRSIVRGESVIKLPV